MQQFDHEKLDAYGIAIDFVISAELYDDKARRPTGVPPMTGGATPPSATGTRPAAGAARLDGCAGFAAMRRFVRLLASTPAQRVAYPPCATFCSHPR